MSLNPLSYTNRLLRSFSVVGFWTLISRIFGFLRDVLLASFLGSGPLAEAFIVAFSIPNMFRRLFAEGAFNTAFVPMFSKKISNLKKAENFASQAFSLLLTTLIFLVALAEIFMPLLVYAMASGFAMDERFVMSVELGRVMFPYILFISLAAFFGGVLNTFGKYSIAAAAPIILNLFLIVALLLANFFQLNFGLAISLAVPLAGITQLIVLWRASSLLEVKIKIRFPIINEEIRLLAKIALPAALAGGVIQINLLVGRQISSFFDGAVAWLSYADRLYQLPLGMVGIAIGVVLLPNLSKEVLTSSQKKVLNTVNRSIEFSLFLILPATAALLIIPTQLISVLFERGAFSEFDTIYTSNALMVYALGLPAFVLQKIISTIFFARGDTKTPFRLAILSMLANIIVALAMIYPTGYLAAAIGTTFSGWLMTLLLWRRAKKLGITTDFRLRKNCVKICFSTLIMAIMVLTSAFILAEQFEGHYSRFLALCFTIFLGLTTYLITSKVLGLFNSET